MQQLKDQYQDAASLCKQITFDIDYYGITEYGLQKMLDHVSNLADYVMRQTVFPDLFFNVSTMSFKFTNLHFTQVQIPIPQLGFYNDTNQIYLSFEDAQAVVSFEFEMQQQIYPYISEKGTGEFGIGQVNIGTFMEFQPADDCLGRIHVELQNFQLYISDIIVKLDSKNSWLYQGILSLMGNLIENVFNEQLKDYFQDFIQDGTNEGLYATYAVYTPYETNNVYGVDQRILNITVNQQFMDLQSVGTFCYFVRNDQGVATCTGHLMEEEESYYLNINKPTNQDLQFILGQQVFNSTIQQFVQNETIQKILKKCKDPQIVNTGILLQCTDINDEELNYRLTIQSQYKDDTSSDYLIYLQLDDQQEYKYQQEINDALYQLPSGADLEAQIPVYNCWNLFQYNNYMSINCDF